MEPAKEFPRVFIGSSKESIKILREVQNELASDADIIPWPHIFQLTSNTLDDLIQTVQTVDFGIFVFSPDDKLNIRNQEVLATRDNVIFEFGLFMGGLGKERCFFIVPSNYSDLHLPTDLLGTKPATFDASRNLRSALGPICNLMRERIERLGVLRSSGSTNQTSNESIPETVTHQSNDQEDVLSASTAQDFNESSGQSMLTLQQVKATWENVKRRVKSKYKMTGAMMDHYTIVHVEGTAEQPVVVIQTSSEPLYKNMIQGDRASQVEWALGLEFGQKCRVRLIPPGKIFMPVQFIQPNEDGPEDLL